MIETAIASLPPAEMDAVIQEFRRGWHIESAQMKIREARMASAGRERRRAIDGVGGLKCSIPAESFHYWGRRLGYDCWKDRQFLREYVRDNPQCGVMSGGTRLQVGYAGDGGSKTKFRKVY